MASPSGENIPLDFCNRFVCTYHFSALRSIWCNRFTPAKRMGWLEFELG